MTSPMEIYQLLPKTNCKKCGESTCMAFGVNLLSRRAEISQCTPLLEEEKYKKNLEKLKGILEPLKDAEETGLIIHDDLCFGCGNCVVACPVNVANDPHGVGIGKGPTNDKVILKVVDKTISAFNIESCRRFGKGKMMCDACIVTCPSKAIEFV
ncbi:MAG: (Fe-S)-binding protein [Halobacteriota archaeon]|nr:(Fe-S)-binding protein [Halobacteriota archaeon]